MVKMLHTACHPPKTTTLSLLSVGQLVDRCREYRRQIRKRDVAGLNKIRECAVLDRQVDTYKKLLFAMAQPDAPPRLRRILDVLLHHGHSASYILDVLEQVGRTCTSHYTRKEKQMGLLYRKLGCHKLLLLLSYNKFGTKFITLALYVHVQYNFQGVRYLFWWMQMNTPEASFYVTLLGSQPNEDFYSLLRCMEHNCNLDMVQLMTRLRTIMSVMKVFEDNPEWKQTRTRYLLNRLKPPGYKGDCKVKNVKLGAVWRQCINAAEKILALHPSTLERKVGVVYSINYNQSAGLHKRKLMRRKMSLWWWKKYRKQQCEPKFPNVMFGSHSCKLQMGRSGWRHMSN